MLYERWRKVAAARREEFALRDAATGRSWTFGELFAAGEGAPVSNPARSGIRDEPGRRPALQSTRTVFPQGHSAAFIFTLLAGWRDGRIICPLEAGQSAPAVPLPPPPCVHLKMTSATTGAARMAAFTAEQLAADAENIVATMGLRPGWPNLGVISMAHSYGFSNLVLPLLLHGVPLVICPAPLPEALRRASEGFAALTLPAVPAMWRAWHDANAIPPNTRLAISAGAPLLTALEQTIFAAHGLKLHNFYGSTECGGIAYDGTETPRKHDALIGEPMHGVRLSVNEEGCLVVRSRAVGETYWPEPATNLGGGVFQTADLVELADGKIFLRGRASDLINVAGRKVWPSIIEAELVRHPGISACLVFGAPGQDAGRNDLIVGCVVAKTPVTAETLRKFLLRKLPAWQIPRAWLFVESLTGNQLGKISRREWRRKFMDEHHARWREGERL